MQSNIVCPYCKETHGKIETPHGGDTHRTCNKEECQNTFKKEWGDVGKINDINLIFNKSIMKIIVEEYICEKCNKKINGTCCRYCGYIKDEGKFIHEIRNENKKI